MKKTILFSLGFLALTAQASEISFPEASALPKLKTVLVTDLDDTVKITGVSQIALVPYRAIIRPRPFSGMPAFLNAWLKLDPEHREIRVLSASAEIFRKSIECFFETFKMPYALLNLKKGKQATQEYKTKTLTKWIEETSVLTQFILVGDDVEKDPDAYLNVAKDFPHRVLSTYIHSVENRSLPSYQTRYLTPWDLSLWEMGRARLTLNGALSVGDEILAQEKKGYVLPKFQTCEGGQNLPSFVGGGPRKLQEMQRKISEKLQKICQTRT